MDLTFLGTRAYIDESSSRHRRHSALLVEGNGQRLMIDCGLDWGDDVERVAPRAILLTHAHPDHAGGLRNGAPCPVYATEESWKLLDGFPIAERQTVVPHESLQLCGLRVTAVSVEHSLNAPAVGYRLDEGQSSILYLPDVAALPEPQRALAGVDLYIADGTAGTGSLLRVEQGQLCGHATLATQFNWCRKAGVPRAVITHCGRELLLQEENGAAAQIATLAAEFNLRVDIAHDGLQLCLP